MPKINVYLPDDLAQVVKETGVPVSAICQRALEQAVRRLTAVREIAADDLEPMELAGRLPQFTGRLRTVLALATTQARAEARTDAVEIDTRHLLAGLVLEGASLGLQVLRSLEIDPAQLANDRPTRPVSQQPETGKPPTGGSVRLSVSAAAALELAVAESSTFGHHYVGTEHLLLGLVAEPTGSAGHLLRGRGAELRLTRRAVAAALAGFLHLRSEIATGTASGQDTAAALTLTVRQEMRPLLQRIERLERLTTA